jgi:hypothetical protein
MQNEAVPVETTSYPSAAALVTSNLLILAATNVLFPLAASRCKEAQSSSVRANLPHGRPAAHRQPHPTDPSTTAPCQREKAKRPLSVAWYQSWNAGPRCMARGQRQHGSGWAQHPYGGAVRLRFKPGGGPRTVGRLRSSMPRAKWIETEFLGLRAWFSERAMRESRRSSRCPSTNCWSPLKHPFGGNFC